MSLHARVHVHGQSGLLEKRYNLIIKFLMMGDGPSAAGHRPSGAFGEADGGTGRPWAMGVPGTPEAHGRCPPIAHRPRSKNLIIEYNQSTF